MPEETHGVKETKEVVVALVGHLTPLLIKRLKDGVGMDDVMAIIDKWKSDDEFKEALESAVKDISKVPSEIKDLDASEGVELAVVTVAQVPKILEALK